jgi:hypothetical protein
MNPTRTCSRIALLAAACALPLCAQTPLFNDGPAFGGSKVFSEGRNPLGNSARYDQPPPGWYLTYLDGDQRAQDNKAALQNVGSTDPLALAKLQDAPWAQRTRAFGIAGIKDSAHFAYTREELSSMVATTDLDPAHLGSFNALLLNGTTVLGRRSVVDRLSFGGSSAQNGTSLGASMRIEQWRNGTQRAGLNPTGDMLPMSDLDNALLGYRTTPEKTLSYSIDMGFTMELAQGLRIGLTADQLNPKHLWDVYLQPQFRAGLQFDLGGMAKLSVEGDINAAARMPFPVKQQTASASLRFAAGPAVALIVGAERRKLGEAVVTRGGVTLQLRTASFLLGVGLQVGQDHPLRGATLMVN